MQLKSHQNGKRIQGRDGSRTGTGRIGEGLRLRGPVPGRVKTDCLPRRREGIQWWRVPEEALGTWRHQPSGKVSTSGRQTPARQVYWQLRGALSSLPPDVAAVGRSRTARTQPPRRENWKYYIKTTDDRTASRKYENFAKSGDNTTAETGKTQTINYTPVLIATATCFGLLCDWLVLLGFKIIFRYTGTKPQALKIVLRKAWLQ